MNACWLIHVKYEIFNMMHAQVTLYRSHSLTLTKFESVDHQSGRTQGGTLNKNLDVVHVDIAEYEKCMWVSNMTFPATNIQWDNWQFAHIWNPTKQVGVT